jgi:hypothetical protein
MDSKPTEHLKPTRYLVEIQVKKSGILHMRHATWACETVKSTSHRKSAITADGSIAPQRWLWTMILRHSPQEYITADPNCEFQGRRRCIRDAPGHGRNVYCYRVSNLNVIM